MALVPGYRDLFGEPTQPYEEWMRNIPSPLGALIAITLNRELDLSQNPKIQFNLMQKMAWRFSQEQRITVAKGFQRYRARTQGRYKNEFFERWYLLEMVIRELNRNANFEPVDMGPQQEYNLFMAYALNIEEVNAKQGALLKAAAQSEKDDLFPYRMVWTGLIYQFQFQERTDPAYEFYKLASILLYAKEKYRPQLKQYLSAMGMTSIGQLMGSFAQIATGAIQPGDDPFLPSLKYYHPLPGVDDSHLRASAINLNLPAKGKTSDLRKFPMFYRPEKGYAVIDQGFYFKKIYRGTQFDLRSNTDLASVDGGVYNSDIAEYVLEKRCFKHILTTFKKSEREQLHFDDKTDNSPDAFHDYKRQGILWEFKGNMVPDKLLEKPSFDSFKAYIDDRLVQNSDGKRKGVSQQAHLIDLMAKGQAPWYKPAQTAKGGKKQQLFPVLCFDDYYFTMPAVNQYLNDIFQEQLTDDARRVFDIMPVTLITLDVLFFICIRKSNFGEIKDYITRYWNIIEGRKRKYQKSGQPADLLPSMASFDEIFHTIMLENLKGRLPGAPMTELLRLGDITQEKLDEGL